MRSVDGALAEGSLPKMKVAWGRHYWLQKHIYPVVRWHFISSMCIQTIIKVQRFIKTSILATKSVLQYSIAEMKWQARPYGSCSKTQLQRERCDVTRGRAHWLASEPHRYDVTMSYTTPLSGPASGTPYTKCALQQRSHNLNDHYTSPHKY
jgi:hypothetical protein